MNAKRMQSFICNFFQSFLLTLLLCLAGETSFAQITSIPASGSGDVSAFCICRHTVNSGTKAIMVPSRTQSEFTSYIVHPPPTAALSLCTTGNNGPPSYPTLSGGSGASKGFSSVAAVGNLSGIASCNLNIGTGGGVTIGCTTYVLINGTPTALGVLASPFSFVQGNTIQFEACCTSATAYSKSPVIKNDYGDTLATVTVSVTTGGAASCP